MIDVFQDDLQEVRTLAGKAFQKRISPATLYRWIRRGANGSRLEAVKLGRKWFTTEDRFREFVEAQTEAATAAQSSTEDTDGSGMPSDVTEDELRACGLL
ncbi:helix-turn-helix domain-containing protein [Rubinisphaera sp.]|uniref:helix-turn-helix domain-containing protein n=1 Tax=Rubinisphaera sp. TaxID=2024857 RepID=UPI000C0F625A|nr:helix-turn-helix domain-containing protein [Rubinisphaera sp.]MBV07802.1 hypothetical protein [Rubinisphaera sp.]HCS50950.1 hypothetical protein [Planctomycetaceae bacterium]